MMMIMPKKIKGETKGEITKAKLLEALVQTNGSITKACRAVGVTNQAYYKYTYEDEQFRLDAEAARLHLPLLAESVLLEHVEDGSLDAAKFVLTKRGRSIGYGDQVTLSGDPKNPIKTNTTIDFSSMPLDDRLKMLEIINRNKSKDE